MIKKKGGKPSKVGGTVSPETSPGITKPVDPEETQDLLETEEDPDKIPDEDPFENPPPFEKPEPGEGP